MKELVSVIVPVRDAGPFLAEAVTSILAQTHRRIELLLVNDGSTDGAVEGLGIADPRLRILESQGEGVSAAFNTGLRRARGRYIARMDADDVALPDRLSIQLEMMVSRPGLAIVGGGIQFFAAAGVAGGNRRYQAWLNALVEPGDIRREMFVENPMPNPTAVFRREALERLGGYADPPWPEDYDLFLRADALHMQMAKVPRCVLRWRDHGRRLTRTSGRYTREAFQRAKAHYLVRSRIEPSGLLLWGAGPGGRLMHDLLVAEGAGIEAFVDVHPRRVGGLKRGLPVWPIERALAWDRGMILVAVGSWGARAKIRAMLDDAGRHEGSDYLFVA